MVEALLAEVRARADARLGEIVRRVNRMWDRPPCYCGDEFCVRCRRCGAHDQRVCECSRFDVVI